MKEKILAFLSNHSPEPRPSPIAIDANLFDDGILDSFRLVELVTFLEAETGLSITEEDINDDRFTSVAGILDLLAAKEAGAARTAGGEAS